MPYAHTTSIHSFTIKSVFNVYFVSIFRSSTAQENKSIEDFEMCFSQNEIKKLKMSPPTWDRKLLKCKCTYKKRKTFQMLD